MATNTKSPGKSKGQSHMPSRHPNKPARGNGRFVKRWTESLKAVRGVTRLSPEDRDFVAYMSQEQTRDNT